MASPKIKIKRGSTFPLQTNFVAGELALNTSTNALYAAIAEGGGTLTNAGPTAGTVTVGTPVAVADGWTAVLTSTGGNFSVPSGSVISVTVTTNINVATGVLVPATFAGTSITGSYTSATGLTTSTNGAGSGLTVTVAHTGDNTYVSGNTTITVIASGSGYTAGDTITVSGASAALGSGSTTANNLQFTLPANFNVSLGGVVTSNAASAVATLSISSKGSAPRPGVLTGIVQYAPGLKWVGAEIEDYTGLLSANFGSRTKLATQGAIKDYVNTVTSSGVTVTDTGGGDTSTFYPTFISGTTSTALRVDTTSTALTYVPSSGTLTAPSFSGPLSGNSTGLHTGALTTSGINEINVTGGNVTLSPVGVASPTVTISPAGTSSAGAVVISPTGGGSTLGTVTIVPTGLLTLGTAGQTTTLSGNLSATGSAQTISLKPTGTVEISPVSNTLTLGTAGQTTNLIGILTAGGSTASITPTGVLTLGTATVATNLVGNLTASGSVALSPASLAVAISPTGTGTVAISPAGALTINPTTASTINNCSIGATTHSTGRFTDLIATTSATINGNFTVTGTQTYLNTTVMTVTDKNIELGYGIGTTGSTFSSGVLTTVPSFGNFTAKLSQALGTLWKLTFTSGTIPVGVRVGTTLAQATITSGNAGYIGSTATVVSISPTEIYYTATGTPVATSGANTFSQSTGNLTVTNEFTGNVTVGGTDTKNMVVGSAITVTGGTALNTPAVAQILSATQLTIVVRVSITVSALTTFSTGAASDATADGGGITVKGTTDKTLTWVSAGNSTWTAGRFSMNQPLEVVQTCTSDVTLNNSCLRLKSDATLDGNGELQSGGIAIDTMIEFTNIIYSGTTTAWFGVDKNNRLKFQTSRNTNVFSVDYEGKVEDCTIDCGTF